MREYPYPMFDDDGKIICQICGKPFLVISPQHLKKHNVKYIDYKNRFPNAPLSNEEFAARGKYGKNKDLFVTEDIMGEEIIIDEEPEIEDFDIKEALQTDIKDPIMSIKFRILDQLRTMFANVEMNYLIDQKDSVSEILQFSFITDFCDPVLKVVIDFPDTFWHNVDACLDANRDRKLTEAGWKLIKIGSTAPSFEEVQNATSEFSTNS